MALHATHPSPPLVTQGHPHRLLPYEHTDATIRLLFTRTILLLPVTVLHLRTSSGSNLENGRTSSNGVVSDGLVATGQDDVGLARNTLRHNDGEAAGNSGGWHEDRPGEGDEGAVQLRRAIDGLQNVAGCLERDGGALANGAGGGDRQHRESLDGQRRVGGRAGDDEGSGERVHLVEVERGVEGRCEWHFGQGSADVSRMAGLGRQDGAGGGEVVSGHDVGGSAKVGGNTDALEDGGEGHERLGVGGGVRVDALGDGSGAGGGEGGGQEGDVDLLVGGDLHQVLVEGVGKAGVDEVGVRVVG